MAVLGILIFMALGGVVTLVGLKVFKKIRKKKQKNDAEEE